jgi:putative endonuclease
MPFSSRLNQGKEGENLAAKYLQSNGLKILERNYRYGRGEIDIVAEEGNELVFVEVKSRRSQSFGIPEEAVTEGKQNQVYAVAEGYLYEKEVEDRPCRFDIVAVEFRGTSIEIRHIRNAF